MTFEKLRDPSTHQAIEPDTIVTSHENPSDWGMVYTRPYLRTFLTAVSKIFEVVLFTAACKEYADQILDMIDPDNHLFHHRLYRTSCQECIPNPSIPEAKVYVKDLRVLGRDLRDVILIDNSLLCFAYQLDNGIVCNPYKGSLDDTELVTMIEILTVMNKFPQMDVRRMFRRMYGISSMIEEYQSKGGRNGVLAKVDVPYVLDTPVQATPNTPALDRAKKGTPRTVRYPPSTGHAVRKSGVKTRSPGVVETPRKSEWGVNNSETPEPPVSIKTIIKSFDETPKTTESPIKRPRGRPSLVPSAKFRETLV